MPFASGSNEEAYLDGGFSHLVHDTCEPHGKDHRVEVTVILKDHAPRRSGNWQPSCGVNEEQKDELRQSCWGDHRAELLFQGLFKATSLYKVAPYYLSRYFCRTLAETGAADYATSTTCAMLHSKQSELTHLKRMGDGMALDNSKVVHKPSTHAVPQHSSGYSRKNSDLKVR